MAIFDEFYSGVFFSGAKVGKRIPFQETPLKNKGVALENICFQPKQASFENPLQNPTSPTLSSKYVLCP
jgi:hypothetical protein